MGVCRNLMPVDKLDAWRHWLEARVEIVTTPVECSPFGVRVDRKVYRVYVRDRTSAGKDVVHASIYGPLVTLAKIFLREQPQ